MGLWGFGYHYHMPRIAIYFLIIFLLLIGTSVWAQEGGGDSSNFELGFHMGSLLPNQIEGVTEMIGLVGARTGIRYGHDSFVEAGIITGNGGGAEWKNAHVDLRMDIPVQALVGIAYVGLDAMYYSGVNTDTKLMFGGH